MRFLGETRHAIADIRWYIGLLEHSIYRWNNNLTRYNRTPSGVHGQRTLVLQVYLFATYHYTPGIPYARHGTMLPIMCARRFLRGALITAVTVKCVTLLGYLLVIVCLK